MFIMINNSNSKPSLTFKDFPEELCSSANIQQFFCTRYLRYLNPHIGVNPRELQGLTPTITKRYSRIIKIVLTNFID